MSPTGGCDGEELPGVLWGVLPTEGRGQGQPAVGWGVVGRQGLVVKATQPGQGETYGVVVRDGSGSGEIL